jgi:hypothetical protein
MKKKQAPALRDFFCESCHRLITIEEQEEHPQPHKPGGCYQRTMEEKTRYQAAWFNRREKQAGG